MLARQLIPPKFIFAMAEIIAASLMITTETVYPTANSTTTERLLSPNDSFIAGCAMIIVMSFVQIAYTFIGINVFNNRIHFESS